MSNTPISGWKPGYDKGEPVDVQVLISVIFSCKK
jgi:hypothetical protein